MARIFKPKYPVMRSIDGKREPMIRNGKPVYRESRKYYIEYADATGLRKRVAGYTDRLATEQYAGQLERQAARERVGIIDVSHEHLQALLDLHITDWMDELNRLGRSARYTRNIKARIERLKTELQWITLASIQPDGLSRWLKTHQAGGMSQRTANHYLEAVKVFCNWCVSQRRMEKNPVEHIANVEVTERIIRRALTLDEIHRLLSVSGPRRTVYVAALLTGLRRNELRQLQWGDVHLDENPRIDLRAETTKAGRADTLPLPDQLASELVSVRPTDAQPTDQVFKSIPKPQTFNSDLTHAKIPKADDRGWTVDFHSLRKTYGTLLAKSGASLREAMQLMRHTDARLTTQIYTDPRLLETSKAVDRLPRITDDDRHEVQRGLKTGTDDNDISSHISKQVTFRALRPATVGTVSRETDHRQNESNSLCLTQDRSTSALVDTQNCPLPKKVSDGTRTRNPRDHNPVL